MAVLTSVRQAAERSRSRASVPLLPDLLSLILLLAALAPVGVEFGRLEFWRPFTQPWPAFLCGAACCGLAAMNRRAGWWLLAALVLGALATTVTLYTMLPGPSWALRDSQLRELVATWIQQLRDGQPIFEDLAVDAWTTAAAWLVGMWMAWAALRAGLRWLVIGAAGAVLVSSIGYQPHWPAAGLALYLFAALLLLARLHHRDLLADAAARGLMLGRAGASVRAVNLIAVGAGAAALVALGFMAPVGRWHTALWQPHRVRSLGGVTFSSAGERSVLHDFGETMPFAGAAALGNDVVASVEAPGRQYLFGVAYDQYQGSGWRSTGNGQRSQPFGSAGLAPVAPTTPAPPDRLSRRLNGATTYSDSSPIDVTVHLQQPASVLLAAGPPLSADEPAHVAGITRSEAVASAVLQAVQYVPRALRNAPPGEFSALVTTSPLPVGGSYTSSGLVSAATPESLRQAGDQKPEWVKEGYLQLPGSVPERVRTLANRLTAGLTNDYDRARAIQDYLRTFPYDEQIAAPPAGEDGVDYLLFVAQRGYCDYFASALAVMLRAINVPSRVIAGYVLHEAAGDGRYQIRERDAHAWTEVFFSGYGWLRFDATPGGAAAYAPGTSVSAPAVAATVLPTPVASPVVPAATVVTNPVTAKITSRRSGGKQTIGPVLWSVVALIACAALLSLFIRGVRNSRRSVLFAWRASVLAGRLTVRRRLPAETAVEYAAAIVDAQPRAGAMAQVATAYSSAIYGPPARRLQAPARLWRRTAAMAFALFVGRLARLLTRRDAV